MAWGHMFAEPLPRFIAQVGLIVLVSRLLALVTRRIGQPMVVAEVVAGILLGPSLFGLVMPTSYGIIFASDSLKTLALTSQLGLILFMFLIGLEFEPSILRGRTRASVLISHSSICVPFGLGALLAWGLRGELSPPGVSFLSFALFMGSAMSITAFPVLARILAELKLLRTGVGTLALTCAAVDDLTAWCLLSFVVATATAAGFSDALTTTLLTCTYIAFMILVARPLLARVLAYCQRRGSLTQNVVALLLLLLLASSLVTEWIGIHALFGAFLFGGALPREGRFRGELIAKLKDVVMVVLLPLFFAFSGVRTHLGLLTSLEAWLTCGLITLVASIGKFGGSALAARAAGLSWRESSVLGVLMNTRGLMELLVLNIGLDLGLLSPKLFTMMVVMALVTTFMTSPILRWLYAPHHQQAEIEPIGLRSPVEAK